MLCIVLAIRIVNLRCTRKADSLGSNPSPSTCQLRGLGHVTDISWIPLSSPVKWYY